MQNSINDKYSSTARYIAPQAFAARPCFLSEFIRLAISMAVTAHSNPLLPTFPPALSNACIGE